MLNKDDVVAVGLSAADAALSNKFICYVRIKRSGAWWLKENCNAMLRMRCAIYNGTLKQVLKNYKASKFNKSN